jgi:hypothetical protein
MVDFVRRRALTPEEQEELRKYLREVGPLVDQLDHEYETWKRASWGDIGRLTIDADPTGEHAAVYVWRVSEPATRFVQHEPVPLAKRYHKALSICLEDRAAAASAFKNAADTRRGHERDVQLTLANRRLRQSQGELNRALKALADLHARLAGK